MYKTDRSPSSHVRSSANPFSLGHLNKQKAHKLNGYKKLQRWNFDEVWDSVTQLSPLILQTP